MEKKAGSQMVDASKVVFNVVDVEVLEELLNDVEAYYRSPIYLQHSDLAHVGAKMRGVHRIRKVLGLSVESEKTGECL